MLEEKLVPNYSVNLCNLVDTEDSVATTKEEEWVTKKKTDIITTKQIETRVKRKLVVEDGKIVEDSGPLVTTNTTEDTEKQEHSQTEHKNLGEDSSIEKWIEVSNPKGCVKEVEEKTVRSRQETEERIETENVKHLGDISDEGYMTVIKSGSDDFRQALEVSNQKGFIEILPKIVHQSQKIKKYIDKEDKIKQSSVQPGGKIINETKTTLFHEELGDYNISDDDDDLSQSSICEKTKKENFQRYRKTKEQDLTEYMADGQKIGERLHYQVENSEGERCGDFFNEQDNISNISSKLKRIKLRAQNRGSELKKEECFIKRNPAQNLPSFDQEEEEAKKAETFKWLEHHFGSESTKSSNGSFEDFESIIPSTQNSFISVTMKSQPLKKNSTPRHFLTSFDEDDDSYNNFNYSHSTEHRYKVSDTYERKGDDYVTSVFDSRTIQSPSTYENQYQNSPKKLDPRNFNSSPVKINEVNFLKSHKIEPYQKFQTISISQKEDKVPTNKTDIKILDFPNYRKQASSPCYQYNEENTKHVNQSPSPIEIKSLNDNENFSKLNSSLVELIKNKGPSPQSKIEGLRTSTLRDNDVIPKKKLYQKTRFAADIPLSLQHQASVKQKNKISDSFRRLIGKLRTNSDTKNKKKIAIRGSRSPSPNENTYENYDSLDHYELLMTKVERGNHEPVAPLRTKYNNIMFHPSEKKKKLMQRYYLGEDPFSASIYGKEKEYEQFQKLEKNQKLWESKKDKSDVTKDFKARTLGRFSKSTSGLVNAEKPPHNNLRGGIKTLPRKFADEIEIKPVTESNITSKTPFGGSTLQEQNKIYFGKADPVSLTSSMINVSIVNKPQEFTSQNEKAKYFVNEFCGPAKPARTYRSKLSRSHSFNIQPGENSSVELYKSNPYFQNLEESPPPLKSPSIISGWSQNSGYYKEKKRQISETIENENLFVKESEPQLFKSPCDKDHKTDHNIGMNFQNEKKTKHKFINHSSSFKSTSNVNTKDSNFGEAISQTKFSKSDCVRPLKIPINTKPFYNNNEINPTFYRSEDSESEYAAILKNDSTSSYTTHLSEIYPEKVLSSKKIVEPSDWKNSKKLLRIQTFNDEKKICSINNHDSTNGIVIKVLNCKN